MKLVEIKDVRPGQVWQFGENDILLHFDYLNKENRLREGMVFADTITKNWKYLGKSKAKIEDLFEVE
nr:MAG TPA: hypothetical protein [Bacteriophage sp.]